MCAHAAGDPRQVDRTWRDHDTTGIGHGGAFSILIGLGGAVSAETLTGTISDAMCGKSHDTMTEHGKKMTDKPCTQACVQHGSAYVSPSGTRVT
jgi:hypothetical protein